MALKTTKGDRRPAGPPDPECLQLKRAVPGLAAIAWYPLRDPIRSSVRSTCDRRSGSEGNRTRDRRRCGQPASRLSSTGTAGSRATGQWGLARANILSRLWAEPDMVYSFWRSF